MSNLVIALIVIVILIAVYAAAKYNVMGLGDKLGLKSEGMTGFTPTLLGIPPRTQIFNPLRS